jgi:hypothetical protein
LRFPKLRALASHSKFRAATALNGGEQLRTQHHVFTASPILPHEYVYILLTPLFSMGKYNLDECPEREYKCAIAEPDSGELDETIVDKDNLIREN